MFKLLFVSFLLVSAGGCSQDPVTSDPKDSTTVKTELTQDDSWKTSYPAHWWRVVLVRDSDGLERLPHQAGPYELVISRRNELRFLHYDAPVAIQVDQKCYSSVLSYLKKQNDWDLLSTEAKMKMLVQLNLLKTLQHSAIKDLILRTDGLRLISDRYEGREVLNHFQIGEVWMEVRKLLLEDSLPQQLSLFDCASSTNQTSTLENL